MWVQGEVSSVHRSPQGHTYFTLSDPYSQINCVVFAKDSAGLTVDLSGGLTVLVHGHLGIYDARSQYQLYADRVEMVGAGAMAAQLEALKRRLAREGLFDESRKRAMPPAPRRIALVTSLRGAAIRDVLQVLRRRSPGCAVVVVPCTVEGTSAPGEISRALGLASRASDADLVLLVRGGGKPEDLWPFNTEEVVRAVAACALPVMTGVGHEIDFTLSDLAADLRAPTPSAAAELAVPELSQQRARTLEARNRLVHAIRRELELKRMRLRAGRQALLRLGPAQKLVAARQRLEQRTDDLARAASLGLERRRARMDAQRVRLETLSPMATVRRGYTLTLAADSNALVTEVNAARAAGRLVTVFASGRVTSVVEQTGD
jgi:exodeoxyribonuclease VII large subunit